MTSISQDIRTIKKINHNFCFYTWLGNQVILLFDWRTIFKIKLSHWNNMDKEST